MNAVRKIEHRRSDRQFDHLALRRECEYQVDQLLCLQRIHERRSIFRVRADGLDRVAQRLDLALIVVIQMR